MSVDLISVVVPSYNHERYIGEALASVFEQTWRPIELIIIDDCSTDGTFEQAEARVGSQEFSGRFERVLLRQNARNSGAHNTINSGIVESRGRYIAILNSDDRFHPNRLKALIAGMRAADSRFAFSGVRCIDGEGNRAYGPAATRFETLGPRAVSHCPTVGFSFLSAQVAISTGNFVFSKDLIDEIGMFADLKYCHDWEFALRMVTVTEPVFLPDELYFYRLHDANSFTNYADIAQAETRACIASLFRRECLGLVKNTLAPVPINWPQVFESYAELAGILPVWNRLKEGLAP